MTHFGRTDMIAQQPAAGSHAEMAAANSRVKATTEDVEETRKLQKAARDFETVFLRQMLSALEKTTKVGDKGPNVAGQQTYGSMIVEAVADAVAQAGGIGLGSVLGNVLNAKARVQTNEAASAATAASPNQLISRDNLRKLAVPPDGHGSLSRNLPQGLPPEAVPRTEIRTSGPQLMGSLADRRIR